MRRDNLLLLLLLGKLRGARNPDQDWGTRDGIWRDIPKHDMLGACFVVLSVPVCWVELLGAVMVWTERFRLRVRRIDCSAVRSSSASQTKEGRRSSEYPPFANFLRLWRAACRFMYMFCKAMEEPPPPRITRKTSPLHQSW